MQSFLLHSKKNCEIFTLPNGEVRGIDASTQVPELYDPTTHKKSSYGYSTIGIPGVVAGLVKLKGYNHG